jgi:hypothetical protein
VRRHLARLLLQRRLRAVLAVGLLCGVLVGVGLWGLAAARRTASTYERYLDATESSDVSLNVNTAERALSLDQVAAISAAAADLPGVVGHASYVGLESMIFARDAESAQSTPEFVGSIDGRFLEQDRVALVEGRLPHPEREHEVLVNQVAADRYGMEVGDTELTLVAEAESIESGEPVLAGEFEAEIVGIGVFPDDVLDDEYDRLGRVLLTPAGTDRWIDVAGSYVWHGLRLADERDADAIVASYREIAGEDAFVNTRVSADQADDVQRALRPLVVGIALFGAAALIAALGIGTIAAVRLSRGDPESSVLRAIGVSPRALQLVTSMPAVAAAVLAAVTGAVLAVTLSPLAPVGTIRAVEPDRGLDLDGLVLGVGAPALALVLAGTGLVAAGGARRGDGAAPRSIRPGAWQVPAWLPAPAALGIRRALGPGRASGAPTRLSLAGVALALVAVVGAITFGASLDRLSDEPARYGWATDVALVAGAGYDTIDPEEAGAIFDEDDRVEALAVLGFRSLEVDGELVSATGLDVVRGDAPITVLDGRLPSGTNEVALGQRTADRLDVEEGDEVAGFRGPLEVVGIVAFPAIGQATSAHPGMGDGALLTAEGLDPSEAQPSVALVGLADGVDPTAVQPELVEAFIPATDGGFVQSYGVLRPAELEGAEDANGTVAAIAATVGVTAVLALAAVVLASVRSRHRELAVLRVLGFTASDLRRSVRWQAASSIAAALLFGLPLGVALGRIVWQTFARTLGVDPAPTVPLVLLAVVATGTAVVAVLAALPAAWRAARLPVAPALRPE